ncbi:MULTISPECIES: sulfur carrier protein ThiS [Lachnospira]|jgi:sulfur carrier protein|uniref:Sulfur carrier protein n=1 Tax=Lachnospira multipara TaxID=28051 RepID=A0A1H5S8Y2_9FIRM|nr:MULTISPECIES: sulfur carrier protein ThiS [Lachnospira]SEF46890.1 sulfur carrier protein [Lachnospira multipara]
MVKINGQSLEAAGRNLLEVVRELEFKDNSYVIEYNLEILKKEFYDKTTLKDGDVVEVVSFMGGG